MSGAKPIKSLDAARVCNLSGIQQKIYLDKIINLEDCEKTLVAAIKDADAAASSEVFWTRWLIGAKIAKLTCDILIESLVIVASKVPVVGQQAVAVSMIYDRASFFVEGLNGKLDDKKIWEQLAANHVDVAGMTLEFYEKNQAAQAVSFLKIGYKSIDGLSDIYETYKSSQSGSISSAKQTAQSQLSRIREMISLIRAELKACENTVA